MTLLPRVTSSKWSQGDVETLLCKLKVSHVHRWCFTGKKWDSRQERWQLMNSVSQREWDKDEKIDRDKKMYEYKSTARWGEAAWVERDQIELKVWNEPKATKPKKQEQLDQSEIGILSRRWSPVPSLPFIPEECRHLLPHPLSCLTVLRSYHHVSTLLHSFPIHTHSNICKHTSTKAHMYINLSGSLALPSISKHLLEYVHAMHTQVFAAVLK